MKRIKASVIESGRRGMRISYRIEAEAVAMTNEQLYLMIGVPCTVQILVTALLMAYMNSKFERLRMRFGGLSNQFDGEQMQCESVYKLNEATKETLRAEMRETKETLRADMSEMRAELKTEIREASERRVIVGR